MSRLLDDRGRLFGKVSLVDLLVLFLIVAVGFFAYGRVRGTTYAQTGILTTVIIEKVKDPSLYLIKEGDVVHDDAGSLIGTVQSVSPTRSPVEFGNAEGEAVGSLSAIYWDVVVTIKGHGQVSKSEIRIGGTRMATGKPLTMLGPGYEVKTTIQSVKPVQGK